MAGASHHQVRIPTTRRIAQGSFPNTRSKDASRLSEVPPEVDAAMGQHLLPHRPTFRTRNAFLSTSPLDSCSSGHKPVATSRKGRHTSSVSEGLDMRGRYEQALAEVEEMKRTLREHAQRVAARERELEQLRLD